MVLVGLDAGEQRAQQRWSAAGAILAPLRSPCCRAWCAQVTVVPESSRVRVLTSGRFQAGTVSTPVGGQVAQAVRTSSIDGQGAVAVEQGHLEEDPEPGDEEHHFRSDEQDHAVAQADRARRGCGRPPWLPSSRPTTSRTWCRARQRGRPRTATECALREAEQALHPGHRRRAP